MIGDLNAEVGDLAKNGVTDVYGAPGVNESVGYLLNVCKESGLIIGITFFKKAYSQVHMDERKQWTSNTEVLYSGFVSFMLSEFCDSSFAQTPKLSSSQLSQTFFHEFHVDSPPPYHVWDMTSQRLHLKPCLPVG